ncbi:MAG: flagellar basal body-associated protein FliL [Verrucomicrobiota bacterium]
MKSIIALISLLVFSPPAAFANPPDNVKSDSLKNATILVVRHGEDADKGHDLSPAGKARANAYVDYFKNYKVNDKPLKLDAMFAAADNKGSHRPRLTIEPTAKSLGISINAQFEDAHYQKLADELRHKPHGQQILICWHHGEIPKLLKALGADTDLVIPKSGWPDDAYNWVIQLNYDAEGRLAHIQRVVEPF